MGQYYKPILLNSKKKTVVAWVSCYDYQNGAKLMEHSYINNLFVSTIENLLMVGNPWYKQPIVWAGDYADHEPRSKSNLYQRCTDKNQIKPAEQYVLPSVRYIINHSKKQFVDKTKVPDVDGWAIHPLPLLTCDGNGRGGGDYRGNEEIIGTWARDVISIEKEHPEGFIELLFNIKQN